MEQELKIVSNEIAEDLKELGFNWKCNYIYRAGRSYKLETYENINEEKKGVIAAPTQALVLKWFRDVHNMTIIVNYDSNELYPAVNYRYEEHEKEGIVEAIKLLKTTK